LAAVEVITTQLVP
jgi:hypothetical protein